MIKRLIFFYFLVSSSLCFAFSIKDRLANSLEGDYLVAKHGKTITLIRIAKNANDKVLLEEISAPISLVKEKDWPTWVSEHAPGHTSWIMYEIDLISSNILESYSFSRGAWLKPNNEENLLISLSKLTLKKVPLERQKKIGPPPLDGETDHRRSWTPPMIIHHEKVEKPEFDILQTKWPDDQTELSGKEIQLYFDKKKEFFFPFWIEVLTDHIALTLKVIDAGHNLSSPKKDIPRRPLEFLSKPKKTKSGVILILRRPVYYNKIQLFTVLQENKVKKVIEIPFKEVSLQGEKLIIEVSNETLKNHLEKNHYYKWIIKPSGSKTISELREPFYFE